MDLRDEIKLAGCCGYYCGLCPRYQSKAKSRCPGCKMLSLTITCKISACCAKRGFDTCAECNDFPCEKNNPETFQWDDFVTRKVCIPNLERIREVGLETWLAEQVERRVMLEHLLAHYDDGRSRSFYCRATTLMPVELIEEAVNETEKRADSKSKASMLKELIQKLALEANIDLKLRKKPKRSGKSRT